MGNRFTVKQVSEKKKVNDGAYAQLLRPWFDLFDRQNILVLSFDEKVNDPKRWERRIMDFLQFDNCGIDTVNAKEYMEDMMGENDYATDTISVYNVLPDKDYDGKLHLSDISSETLQLLQKLFDPLNEEFYELLKSNPGPSMEQNPFPKFVYGKNE